MKRRNGRIATREARRYDLQYDIYQRNLEPMFTLMNFGVDKSDLVLDVGAGTGRFTSVFASKALEVVAVDYSLESLRINRSRCDAHVVLADICYLPFRPLVFDRIAGIGVFQHIPTWPGRFRGLKEIRRVSKRGAKVLVSVYNYRLKTRGLGRQGYHCQGLISYYSFLFTEFRQMLIQVFPRITDLRCVLNLSFLMKRLYMKRLQKFVIVFEALVEKSFLSFLLGERLVAICEA